MDNMTEKQKRSIIESGKQYFREIIIPNHVKGLEKLKLKDFKVLIKLNLN